MDLFNIFSLDICGPCVSDRRDRSAAKQYCPVNLVTITFKRLSKNWLNNHEKDGLLSDIQHGFTSPGSTADLLKVSADRNARTKLMVPPKL